MPEKGSHTSGKVWNAWFRQSDGHNQNGASLYLSLFIANVTSIYGLCDYCTFLYYLMKISKFNRVILCK